MPAQFMPLQKNAQDLCTVALLKSGRYSFVVAAKSATGFGDPSSCRRTGAPITIAGAFFVPASLFYGGCAWETFGSAGVLYARSVNLRTAATLIRLTANSGSSSHTGDLPDAHSHSVQNLRHCLSRNGTRHSAHRWQPHGSYRPLLHPDGQHPHAQ